MYSPRPVPQLRDQAAELALWTGEEFRNVARTFQESEQTQYTVLSVAPEKPREGLMVFADGTNWNPGQGRGSYVYSGGAWVKLLGTADADALFLTQAEGDARYLLNTPAAFSVNKGGSPQSGIASNVATVVTWSVEVYDIGNRFASNAWTPPAGKISLTFAYVASGTIPGGAGSAPLINKNGASFKQTLFTTISSITGGIIHIEDVANGTDTYAAAVVVPTSAGTVTVAGDISQTYFMGHWISP